MHVLEVRNVNEALYSGLDYLTRQGFQQETRNGGALVAPNPVTTAYERPDERVLFEPRRDANPFFHLMEGLWMLAGRDDVDFVARYVGRMRTYSDDGKTLHGAYGRRWRSWFGGDQLQSVIDGLRANPGCRRQVIQMWDAPRDLNAAWVPEGEVVPLPRKDVPCNMIIHLNQNAASKKLDMTVFCRSNDMIWGAYGANAVHFSMLHEYLAAAVGMPLGTYYQISDNYHAYRETFDPLADLADKARDPFRTGSSDPYRNGEVTPYPLVSKDIKRWDRDLKMFMEEPTAVGFDDPFFRRVAVPMAAAHTAFRNRGDSDRFAVAREIMQQVAATDWRKAGLEWLERREGAFRKAQDDGPKYA